MKSLATIALILLLLLSCKKPEDRNCFKSAGEDTERMVELEDFLYLDCMGNFNLNLIQDSINKVVVKGGENLVRRIEFEKRNDSLYIINKNSCRFLRSYDKEISIDLYYKDIDYFKFDGGDTARFINPLNSSYFKFRMRDGGGTVYLNVDSDYIDINLESGSGDIFIKGSSFYSRLFLNSTGYLHGDSLVSNNLDALNYGSGKLYCNADSSQFVASIIHVGNIYYRGTPSSKELNKVGSGELIKINP